MKKIVIATFVLGLLFAGLYTNNAEAAAAKKPYQGQVVSLDDVIKGVKDLQLTKERAAELEKKGSPLVFLYNKKIYFVQTEGGDFAFNKIANFAHKKKVGITGTLKTVKGINVIIMSNIESMD